MHEYVNIFQISHILWVKFSIFWSFLLFVNLLIITKFCSLNTKWNWFFSISKIKGWRFWYVFFSCFSVLFMHTWCLGMSCVQFKLIVDIELNYKNHDFQLDLRKQYLPTQILLVLNLSIFSTLLFNINLIY